MSPHGNLRFSVFMRGHLQISGIPGTIVGPNAFEELLVLRQCDCPDRFGSMEAWTITAEDAKALRDRENGPQSVTEFRLTARRFGR